VTAPSTAPNALGHGSARICASATVNSGSGSGNSVNSVNSGSVNSGSGVNSVRRWHLHPSAGVAVVAVAAASRDKAWVNQGVAVAVAGDNIEIGDEFTWSVIESATATTATATAATATAATATDGGSGSGSGCRRVAHGNEPLARAIVADSAGNLATWVPDTFFSHYLIVHFVSFFDTFHIFIYLIVSFFGGNLMHFGVFLSGF
jgi:hypothetical protein